MAGPLLAWNGMDRRLIAVVCLVTLCGAAGPANGASRTILAQRLVDEFVELHPELAGLELAVAANGGCRTVAATAREDVGELCDADELGPIRTGMPDVEAPSRHDPVYDITQALHDANGELVGAAGMDLKPAPGASREAVLNHARTLLHELESRIPSKERLLQPAP